MFTACQSGYYGNKCQQPCSGHCLNNLVCNNIDGTCSDGCEAGYIGKLCHACEIFYFPNFDSIGYSFTNENLLYSHIIFFFQTYTCHGWVL